MRILQISSPEELKGMMRDINVDTYGIKIMLPKGIAHIIRVNSLRCVAANVLKQEMLSLGGDVAVSRDALTAKVRATDCILMASISQLNRLSEKLKKQPFGLNRLANDLISALNNYQTDKFTLNLGGRKLFLKDGRPCIMGVINLTPDSFSDDGIYRDAVCGMRDDASAATRYPLPATQIIDLVLKLVNDGADIIDIGGESSRPGAKPVSAKEELSRAIPVIKLLAKKIKVPISIDTYKPEVARRALDNGAAMVNDITGLKDPRMRKVVSQYKSGAVIMHMKGRPRTMQKNPAYGSLIDEIMEYLSRSIDMALSAGISKNKIIVDPGIGFGKTLEHNLELLKNLREFKVLGLPILVGPSRKSFIGEILNAGPKARIFGTVAACILAAKNGANIIRVHDVKQVKDALEVASAILSR